MITNSDYSSTFDPAHAAQEIGISTAAYLRLCRLFVQSTRRNLAELKSAAEAADFSAASEKAHEIKGAARNMEFDTLTQIAVMIRRSAERSKTEELGVLISRLQEEFDQLSQMIGEHL
jgi:HPt (histidine-containing phosphotransfer) domain-containing protein